jgi:hypothetical protein
MNAEFLNYVLLVIAVAFAGTVLIALFATLNMPRLKKYVSVKKAYADRLFKVAVIEIVVLCMTFAGQSLMEARVTDVERVQAEESLSFSTNEWAKNSLLWLNEPSDLAATPFRTRDDRPLLLAVDDDEPGIFLIEARNQTDRTLMLINHMFSLADIADIEGAAWNQGDTYYVMTSHRRLDESKRDERQDERKLLSFRIERNSGSFDRLQLVGNPVDLTFGNTPLQNFLEENNVAIDRGLWKKNSEGSHPYALELEGLAFHDNKLYMGMKWPLDASGRALLLTWDIRSETFVSLVPLDFNGNGITALTVDPETKTLLIAVNPPQRMAPELAGSYEKYGGKSQLYVVPVDELGKPDMRLRPILNVQRLDAKLEGIAVIDGLLVLSYDGRPSAFVTQPRAVIRQALNAGS